LNSRAASTATAGIAELATDDESKTGTDTARAVTPANLRAAVSGQTSVTGTTHTAAATDSVIMCNNATGVVVTLPAASGIADKRYTIANIGVGLVTVDGNGSETVGGLPKQCIGQNEAITIDCDGSNWHIVHDARVKSSENLLGNSGFGCWSNSELNSTSRQTDFNVSNLLTDTDGSTYADWGTSQCTVTDSGTNLLMTMTAETTGSFKYNFTTLEAGKLYKVVAVTADGTGSWDGDDVIVARNIGDAIVATYTGLTAGTHSFIFEATAADNYIQFIAYTKLSGETFNVTSVYVDEVTPGIVSGNAGPDGWYKTADMDIWRQHQDSTYTKDGSFYSLKCVSGAATDAITYTTNLGVDPLFRDKFSGRTVTYGMWIYATDASEVRLNIYDSVNGHRYSDYHTGGSSLEWLELTATIGASPTTVRFTVVVDSGGITFWFSQPMLVFGSSIGEGNFCAPVGEWVNCEAKIYIVNNGTPAAGDDEVLYLEALTEGKIPKGLSAVDVKVILVDSAVANNAGIYLKSTTSASNPTGLRCMPQVDDRMVSTAGTVNCDTNGDIWQEVTVAGSTLSTYYVVATRVQVST
jgi:hypothetical protein